MTTDSAKVKTLSSSKSDVEAGASLDVRIQGGRGFKSVLKEQKECF